MEIPSKRKQQAMMRSVTYQNYFFKVVYELCDQIIASALEFTFKKYNRYPNIYAIRQAKRQIQGLAKLEEILNDKTREKMILDKISNMGNAILIEREPFMLISIKEFNEYYDKVLENEEITNIY